MTATISQPQLESRGQNTPLSKPLPRLIFDKATSERNKTLKEEPVEKFVNVQLYPTDLSKTTKVGTLLSLDLTRDLEIFLAKNVDVLDWSHEDIPGIDPSFMMY